MEITEAVKLPWNEFFSILWGNGAFLFYEKYVIIEKRNKSRLWVYLKKKYLHPYFFFLTYC